LRPLEFELAYLASLTKERLKPVSRWEKPGGRESEAALRAAGLRTRSVRRILTNGREKSELVFSDSAACLDLYSSQFDGRRLKLDEPAMRLEGLLFGYPRCCVESYVAHGYRRNSLRRSDQRILFHWACPRCLVTPRLLPAYRRVYRETRRLVRGWPVAAGAPADEGVDKQGLRRVLATAAAVLALGCWPGAAHGFTGDDPHQIALEASQDPDGDLLLTSEERILGTAPELPDEDVNQVRDGVDLARSLAWAIDALPTEASTTRTYVVHHLAFGLETCEVCGQHVNMGLLEVVNPLENDSLGIPYIGRHFLEHGSFSYTGTVHSGRVSAPWLRALLSEVGHRLPAPDDGDGDLLTDAEEAQIRSDPSNADEDRNQAPDGLDLARRLASEIGQLPTTPDTKRVYRTDFAAKGLECCAVCGATVNMGHLTVCNPLAHLYAKLPYIALHYLEHGSFCYGGDVHGAGRGEVQLLVEALHSPGPSHLRPVSGDGDDDGLTEAEERFFGTAPDHADTDGDGAPDGFARARALALAVNELTRKPNTTCYAVDHLLRGVVACETCGAWINMGYVEVVNPRESLVLNVPYLALHCMERGSLVYAGSDRVNPRRLALALHGTGTSHVIVGTEDEDRDGLLAAEELLFGTRPDQADTDQDGVLDGVALARWMHAQIVGLPASPTAQPVYVAHHEADCYAPCPLCGEEINCGDVEVTNTPASLSVRIPYLNLHFLQRGSFAVSPEARLDPARLAALLHSGLRIRLEGGRPTLRWAGALGRAYQVMSAPDLSGPWTAGQVLEGTGAEMVFRDETATGAPRRFYYLQAK
jgi:hypothetical protein